MVLPHLLNNPLETDNFFYFCLIDFILIVNFLLQSGDIAFKSLIVSHKSYLFLFVLKNLSLKYIVNFKKRLFLIFELPLIIRFHDFYLLIHSPVSFFMLLLLFVEVSLNIFDVDSFLQHLFVELSKLFLHVLRGFFSA